MCYLSRLEIPLIINAMTSKYLNSITRDLENILLIVNSQVPKGIYDYKYVFTNSIAYKPLELTDEIVDESISFIKKNKKIKNILSSENRCDTSQRYKILANNKKIDFKDDWIHFNDDAKLYLSTYITTYNSGYIDNIISKKENNISFSEYMRAIVDSYYAEWFYKTNNIEELKKYIQYAKIKRNHFADGSHIDFYMIGYRYEITLDDYRKLEDGEKKARFDSIEEWSSSPVANEKNKPKSIKSNNHNNLLFIDWMKEGLKSIKIEGIGNIHRPYYLNDYEYISNTIQNINRNIKQFIYEYVFFGDNSSQDFNIQEREYFVSRFNHFIKEFYGIFSDVIIRYLNTDVLKYPDLIFLYKEKRWSNFEYISRYFGLEDSFDCKYFEFISSNELNWRLYYKVLEYGDNQCIWDAIIRDNFMDIYGSRYFPESFIEYDKFLKRISKHSIDIIKIYNKMDVKEINFYINESMKRINRFMYHWYFNDTYYGQYISVRDLISNYSEIYSKTYEFYVDWRYKEIEQKTFINIDNETSLTDRNFRLFSQMYLEEIYNSSIVDYCTEFNIDVSPKWKSEYELYQTLKNNLNVQILYQYSPKWLNKQTFDIFIPTHNIAVEYQGIQHYEAVDFFGGGKGLEKTIKRDTTKAKLAEKNNCTLIYHKYDDDIENTLRIILNIL